MVNPKKQITKSWSMRDRVVETLQAHRNDIVSLLSRYVDLGKGILQPHHLLHEIDNLSSDDSCKKDLLNDGPFGEILQSAQEGIILPPYVALAVRPRPGVWEFIRVNVDELSVEQLTVSEYLLFKD